MKRKNPTTTEALVLEALGKADEQAAARHAYGTKYASRKLVAALNAEVVKLGKAWPWGATRHAAAVPPPLPLARRWLTWCTASPAGAVWT